MGAADALRRARRAAALSSAVTALGAAAVLLGPLGKRAALPGPLVSAHRPLAQTCEACHPQGELSVKGLAHGLTATPEARAQSELCLACHFPGQPARAAHGRYAAPDELAAALARGVPGAADAGFECATCHREHRGDAPLAQLDDARCQACHERPFASLADGHPEPERWSRSGAAVRFDHARHVARHFPGEPAAPRACGDCHVLDAAGERMPVRGFERACAACHGDDAAGEGADAGLALLALPALDVLALEDAADVTGADGAAGIGAWPADAAVAETPLPAFAEALLPPELAPALVRFRALDPLDLASAEPEELADVARVAWGVKELLRDVARDGHGALAERLERALGRPLAAGERARLAAGLPAELVQGAVAAWLPDLERELEQRAAGAPPATGEGALADDAELERDGSRARWVSGGGWYRQEADFTLRYRAADHADPFLRTWCELAGELGAGAGARAAAELAPERGAPPGACAECHDLRPRDGAVRWTSAPPPGRALTRFAHGPHLVGAADAARCTACHALADEGGAGTAALASGLLPVRLERCAGCHGEGGARASCLTCHRYHAREGEPPLPHTPLELGAGARRDR